MQTVTDEDPISLDELRRLAAGRFGDLVKAVVDLERRINLRPSFGNRSRGVDDAAIRERIARLVAGLVRR